MNEHDQFEELLKRQALRPSPPGWRAEILRVARREAAQQSHARATTSLGARLLELLWPHPVAWAGLAAAWVLVFALSAEPGDAAATNIANQAASPSGQVRELLKEQQQLYFELTGLPEGPGANRVRPLLPQPRSQVCPPILCA